MGFNIPPLSVPTAKNTLYVCVFPGPITFFFVIHKVTNGVSKASIWKIKNIAVLRLYYRNKYFECVGDNYYWTDI